jgi:hypothetical protein
MSVRKFGLFFRFFLKVDEGFGQNFWQHLLNDAAKIFGTLATLF